MNYVLPLLHLHEYARVNFCKSVSLDAVMVRSICDIFLQIYIYLNVYARVNVVSDAVMARSVFLILID